MLKFEHGNGASILEVEGNLVGIATEVGTMLKLIYNDLLQKKA